MLLWLSLSVAVLCYALVAGIIVHRQHALRRPVLAAGVDERPTRPVRRRRRVIPSATPPPPPPPPANVPDAAPAEEVSFEKLIDLVEVNLETNNLVLAAQYLEELRTRFMDKPPSIYFEHMLALAEKKGDPEMEVESLEQLARLVPDELRYVERLADAYLRADRAADAEPLVEGALTTNADSLPLLKLLAKVYRKTDEHEKAVELKQRIHHLEEELRHRGELPPDPEAFSPAARPEEPPAPPAA